MNINVSIQYLIKILFIYLILLFLQVYLILFFYNTLLKNIFFKTGLLNHVRRAKKCHDEKYIAEIKSQQEATNIENAKLTGEYIECKTCRKMIKKKGMLNHWKKSKCSPDSIEVLGWTQNVNSQQRENRKERYHVNSEPLNTYQKERYHDNSELLKSYQKERYHDNSEPLKSYQKDYQRKRYSESPDNKKDYQKKQYAKNPSKQYKFDQRLEKFKFSIGEGKYYPCISCRKKFLQNLIEVNVLQFEKECKENNEAYNKLFQNKLPQECCVEGKYYICSNCNGNLQKNKLPPQNYYNGLQIEEQPDVLKQLSDQEATLISPMMTFFKIYILPVSGIHATKDRMILVPISSENINKTVSSLPHPVDDSGIIPITLKRKKDMKNSMFSTYVNVKNITEALQKFNDLKNPYFTSTPIEDNAELMNLGNDVTIEESSDETLPSEESNNETADVDEIEELLDPVSAFQFTIPSDSGMFPFSCLNE